MSLPRDTNPPIGNTADNFTSSINYYVEDYGKVYRSCGNCDSQCTRNVNISGTTAYGGDELAGINEAFGDSATLDNICTDADHPCAIYDGCEGDCEPEKVGYC